MAKNIKKVMLADVIVPENRQRFELKDIDQLAASIERVGLLHPIILRETLEGALVLVAGERRFRAHELLVLQGKDSFGKIEARFLSDLSDNEAMLVELEENVKRADLHWKEQAHAIKRLVDGWKMVEPTWSLDRIAEEIGYSKSRIYRVCKVADELLKGNERVASAATLFAAINVIERDTSRKLDNAFNDMMEDLDEEGNMKEVSNEVPEHSEILDQGLAGNDKPDLCVPGTAITVAKQSTASSTNVPSIHNLDFIDWAETYSGPKFNLIHCDFPYGIDHGESDQGGAATWGAYKDSPDIYWQLCRALAHNRDRLMMNSCHIMFWFSMKWYVDTIEFFKQEAPDLVIQPFPLVWYKTDNKGVVPDITRQPRRVYETAFIMARGDRKIIQPIANCYGAPTGKSEAIHISEKPVPVLKHFYRMFVDEHSRVLDPTAGGGSSILAAEEMGAELALGIELDPEYAEAANKRIGQARNLRKLSNLTKKDDEE